MKLNLIFQSTFCILNFGALAAPNILLIVSEDNGQELSCYGEPYVQTPVLDNLATEGVLFKNAYVAQAGCSQCRASFLTGLYPHQNGQIGLATWKFRMYDENTPNIVRSLKESGYRTGLIGKLHVNPESAFPFDFKAISSANFGRKDQYRYATEAKRFMTADDSPFFLSVNFPDAHRPFTTQVDGLPSDPLSGDDVKPLEYFGIDNAELRQQTADYYNCMNRLDTLIGELLQALDETGKAEDTIVVYFGDHGADMLRGKRTSYEGGTRVPLIVKWPSRWSSNHVSTELVSLVDLAPTLLEAAGARPIPNLPGRSLDPLLKRKSTNWREYLFTEYHIHSAHNYYPQRTVQNRHFKLIRNLMPGKVNPGYMFTNNRFFEGLMGTIENAEEPIRSAYLNMERPVEYELYDLKNDPHEFSNLINDSSHAKELARLKKELQAWREETNDPMLNPRNVLRLKAEVNACFTDGQPDKKKLTLTYPEYFFE
ncbi:MAG: sulfatase [Opitutales bacterium]|jgi:N-sulfoglucosamine sulfohydrolase|nr:sulfatase [Opitutales bacterium]MBT7864804.1 sulfatase [Opitutales bacterium]